MAPPRPPRRVIDLDTAVLRSFRTLAETGSFTRTAERVGRTQPAVTQQIRRLEAALGHRVVVRGKRVALTAAGETLLGYARQILDLADSASAALAGAGDGGEVRFGSPEDIATFFLPEILARFTRRHPAVRLQTTCALTLDLLKGLGRRSYDVVVIKQEPHAIHPGAVPVWRERLVWVGPAEPGVFTPGPPLRLALSPEPCVYRARAVAALAAAGKDGAGREGAGLAWSIVYTSPSLAGVAAAVRAGLGITVLPRTMIPPGLAPLSLPGLPPLADTVVCVATRAGAPAAAGAFARFVTETFGH
jgi:DNA-binding transcriptional LysR family regulator